jgi:hypothetical protein
MLAPFEASDLKIARAKKHLQELETEVATFFSTKPYRLVVEPSALNSQTGFVSHAWDRPHMRGAHAHGLNGNRGHIS